MKICIGRALAAREAITPNAICAKIRPEPAHVATCFVPNQNQSSGAHLYVNITHK